MDITSMLLFASSQDLYKFKDKYIDYQTKKGFCHFKNHRYKNDSNFGSRNRAVIYVYYSFIHV